MSEYPHIVDASTFEPDALHAMAHALDEACAALKVSDSRSRNAIAVRILALARTGVIDVNKLRERVLQDGHLNYY
jgi:hypothetical protein